MPDEQVRDPQNVVKFAVGIRRVLYPENNSSLGEFSHTANNPLGMNSRLFSMHG
jgi:hypothetical protein